MDTSILNSTKKILGIDPNDTSFDPDVITHLNSAFSVLSQLGVGPAAGYSVADETSDWADLGITSEPILNLVKTCVWLRVRVVFDPPGTSYLMDAFRKQIEEHEWRLSTMREETGWVDPDPPPIREVI